jgi:DNA repair exonuclease SbcCD ATPase subunit
MIPIKLTMENFCLHEDSEIDFSKFSAAIIVGEQRNNSEFSNGVGKSTIFHAIKYVLFNQHNYSTMDKLIRKGADICRVAFEFSDDDGSVYRVVRSRSRKSGPDIRLYKADGDGWGDITQRRGADTEVELEKLIKINYKTFVNSLLFSQGDLTSIASLTAEKRKAFFKEALNLGKYSKFEKVAKSKYSEINKEIDRQNTIISTIGNPLEDMERLSIEIGILGGSIDDKVKIHDGITVELVELNQSRLEHTASYKSIEKENANLINQERDLSVEVNKLTSNLADNLRKRDAIKISVNGLISEFKTIKNQFAGIDMSAFEDVDKIGERILAIDENLNDYKGQLRSIQLQLEELAIPLPADGSCKHCRQPLSSDHLNLCRKEIEDAKVKLNGDAVNIRTQIKSLSDEKVSLNAKLTSINKSIQRRAELKSDLTMKQKEIESKKSMYEEYIGICDGLQTGLNEKIALLDSVRDRKSSSNIDEQNSIFAKIAEIEDRIRAANTRLNVAVKELSVLRNQLAVCQSRIEEKAKSIEVLAQHKEKLVALEKSAIVHQKVCMAFGSAGIPSLIAHTILEDYQMEANNLLEQIKPEIQLTFSLVKDASNVESDDTLDIKYYVNGDENEFAQLSGAQQLIVSLALRLGLSFVLQKRLGSNMKLILLDEVDSALDKASLKCFVDVIKLLQREFKILLITHNDKLRDHFGDIILVEQGENLFSRAKYMSN